MYANDRILDNIFEELKTMLSFEYVMHMKFSIDACILHS